LDPDRDYLLWDFWGDEPAGTLRRRLRSRLPRQSCRLLAVREKRDRPQLLSINRHISQGGVCVRSLRWEEESRSLEATLDLPAGEEFLATIALPAGYALARVSGTAEVRETAEGLVRLAVHGGTWRCAFPEAQGGRGGAREQAKDRLT
jgi:hypothetical protein